MKKRILYGIISFLLIVSGLFIYSMQQKDKETIVHAEVDLNLSCGSAYLIEQTTGKVIYAQNEEVKMYPASMTKMMGLILVCEALENEQIKLDDMVSVSSAAASMGGSQVFLQPLEMISVDELIKCVCIASANDAMYALSELIATTNDNFIKMMNDKVKELNLSNTNFVNVTGFDHEDHYTCAKDMALIAKELLKYEDIILPYTSTYDSYIRNDTNNPFWLVNTNKMVKYYQGMDGLKTGFTSKAGFCLTSTAKRNDVRLISVIMKADSSTSRNAMTKTLLDYGFSKVNCKKLYNKDSIITTIKLDKAKNEQIDLYVVKDVNLIYEGKLDESLIEKEIILNDDFTPPVSKESIVGYLIIKYNNEEYKYPLTVKEDIEPLSIKELIGKYLKDILI